MKPTIGRIVIYRSRTGKYDVPAIVTATVDTLNREGVEAGHVPDLSGPDRVHLTVFTPGKSRGANEFENPSPHGQDDPAGGTYREWDVPTASSSDDAEPGSWRWPDRV